MHKAVLDACCGGRMMWFDKNNPSALYADVRSETLDTSHYKVNPGRKSVQPDLFSDFTKMPFPDNSFWHVVYDPPHVRGISMKSCIGFSYGSLDRESWAGDLANGFSECFRVLKPNGTLIFKWAEVDIPLSEILSLTPYQPMYGHRSGKKELTHWCAFIKPNEEAM